jgi:SAM-dependent methyltransferase
MSGSSARKTAVRTPAPPVSVEVFLDEYSRDDVIAKYLDGTAGTGIAYALTHVYGPVYLEVIRALIARRPREHRFRVLEYGCGGGMNLLKVVELIHREGAQIDEAIGADFSPRMIEAARQDGVRHLPRELAGRVRFTVASNETLARDLATGLGRRAEELEGTFDLVVGVNTFRYSHRLQKADDCARDIWRLLAPGGYSVMIDMNRRFPLFRSRLADMVRGRRSEEAYLPSLAEYANPFRGAGFIVEKARNFCWVPHSAGRGFLALCRGLAPLLDVCCPGFAMRSLVVAHKPESSTT